MLATDRTTHWVGPDGKKFVMPRQLLYIWVGVRPEQLADMTEQEQSEAEMRQHAAKELLEIFPSESEPKKKAKSKTA